MARIVLNTFGSLGDLHPYLALAIGLSKRGHAPVLATSDVYRAKIEALGIEFAPVRPDVGELLNNPEFVRKLWHPRQGTEYLIRDYILPHVADSFEDLAAASRGADLLLTHGAAYAGPIVGEALGLRWISVALQPAIFFSAFDPSVVAPAPGLRHLYFLGPAFYRFLLRLADRRVRRWLGPLLALRRRLHLPPPRLNPVMQGQFSPFGSLALFSRHFAAPQKDWPAHTRQPGFLFYDQLGVGLPGFQTSPLSGQGPLSPDLDRFLNSGEPPVLFTLGSSAVLEPGSFFVESLRAAELSGRRAILLVGHKDEANLAGRLPPHVFLTDYVPYSEVMPRCAAIIHQGGIGTTAQSLRAGKPVLIVPWAHDQPDNAERLRKLGVGRTLHRSRYRAPAVVRALRSLLGTDRYSQRASDIGRLIAREDGERLACDAVESFLTTS